MSKFQVDGITRKLKVSSDNRLLIRNLLHRFKSARTETFKVNARAHL